LDLNFKNLTDAELLSATKNASQKEKAATFALLLHLIEVDQRKAYSRGPHSSLFDYVVRALGYSESQASERINAVRLIRENKVAKEHIESGALSLSNAAQIQRFMNHERRLSRKLPERARTDVILECLKKSKREVERYLISQSSEPVKMVMQEKVRILTPTQTELKIVISTETEAKITRARELVRAVSISDLMDMALDALIEKREKSLGKVDPKNLRRSESETLEQVEFKDRSESPLPETKPERSEKYVITRASRFIPMKLRQELFRRSGGRCEWVDPETHERCRAHAFIEVDHIIPYALGGATAPQNLRHLCRAHNERAAIDAGLGFNYPKREPLKAEGK
jgi:hypothetical protein